MPDIMASAESPEDLRVKAARARRFADSLVGDPAEPRLLALAAELEARATSLEKATQSKIDG
jgi:hypothetical protein